MGTTVADEVWRLLAEAGFSEVFSVSGGMIAPLLDSVARSSLAPIFMHHEQSCAMAADAYFRTSGRPAVTLVTNGPGVANALTGVLGAYQDSIPMVVISGQVKKSAQMSNSPLPLRQLGVQEADTEQLVAGFVKSFERINGAEDVGPAISRGLSAALSGRPGPVWIEIPIDVQGTQVASPGFLESSAERPSGRRLSVALRQIFETLGTAKRPLLLVGNGVHIAGVEREVREFAESIRIPVVASWSGADVFDHDSDLYIGNVGLLGERAANNALQQADVLLVLGSRLSIPIIGHEPQLFASSAVKIMVDIDPAEISKPTISIDLPVEADLRAVFPDLTRTFLNFESEGWKNWRQQLLREKHELSLEKEEFLAVPGKVDAYSFVARLGQALSGNEIIVTDMGTSFTSVMQALRRRNGTRLMTSSGTSSMGFGLPGAIGAYFANPSKTIICVAGDGGFQMTVQELATVRHHNIPLKIFILNSEGYLAISLTQDNLFNGARVGSGPASGLSTPSLARVADAYGISAEAVGSEAEINETWLRGVLEGPGPKLVEMYLPQNQLMRPRVMAHRRGDGSFTSPALDQMWPPVAAGT